MIAAEALALLACPICEAHAPLKQLGGYLVCTADGTGFPIVGGIPQLLPESAIAPTRMKELAP